MRARILWLAATVLSVGTGAAPAFDATSGPIKARTAVSVFEATCVKALPRFRNLPAAVKPLGLGIEREHAARNYPSTPNVSFRILDGPGKRKTCEMTFVSKDNFYRVERAVKAVAPKAAFDDFLYLYGGSSARIMSIYHPRSRGSLRFYQLTMISER